MAKAIKKLTKKLKLGKIVLWCRGSSGAIIAGYLASKFPESHIVHVKKAGESSHGTRYSDSCNGNGFNIIVDDFVSTGATIAEIGNVMKRNNHHVDCVCVAGTVSEYQIKRFDFDFSYLISDID